MYITFTNKNGEETYCGPYTQIAEDSLYDNAIMFLCTKEDGTSEYVRTPYAFGVVTDNYND